MPFLDALQNAGAAEVFVHTNERLQIEDEASLIRHEDIHYRYADHMLNMNLGAESISVFREYIVHAWGGNNLDSLTESVRKLPNLITKLSTGDDSFRFVEEVTRVSDSLLLHLVEERDPISLRELWGLLGTNSSQFGDPNPAEVIPKLWERLIPHAPGASLDQVFGKAPVDTQGYDQWPRFLAAIVCHSMLNTLGFRRDEHMTDVRGVARIMSDGSHLAHAMFCHVLLTEDKRFWAKARATYAYLGVATEACLLRNKTS